MNTIIKLNQYLMDLLFGPGLRVLSVGLLPGPEGADRPILVTVEEAGNG